MNTIQITSMFLIISLLSGCMGGKTLSSFECPNGNKFAFGSGKEYAAISATMNCETGLTVHAVGVGAFEGQRIEADMWKSFWTSAIEGAKLGSSGGAYGAMQGFVR